MEGGPPAAAIAPAQTRTPHETTEFTPVAAGVCGAARGLLQARAGARAGARRAHDQRRPTLGGLDDRLIIRKYSVRKQAQ